MWCQTTSKPKESSLPCCGDTLCINEMSRLIRKSTIQEDIISSQKKQLKTSDSLYVVQTERLSRSLEGNKSNAITFGQTVDRLSNRVIQVLDSEKKQRRQKNIAIGGVIIEALTLFFLLR